MSDIVVVRSIVSLVWYPEVRSVTLDALDAVVESVIEGDINPPSLPEDNHARPMDWTEQIRLLFDAAAFVKTCIEIYELAPSYEDARRNVASASASASEAIRVR